MSFSLQFKKYISEGARFQSELAEFIVKMDLRTIVETGYGLSTLFILNAINSYHKPESMKLYTIDPDPWFKEKISHAQHTFIKDKSVNVLSDLYDKTGAWDLFLHDSNHDILCQTYEFYMAYDSVRPGGFIACDDYTWGEHGAWRDFCESVKIKPFQMGSLQVIQLPKDHVSKKGDHKACLKRATKKEVKFLAAGGQNSPVFQ